ncbi:MAG: flagellar hook basal-body protein [Novosphingobium sp.]
MPRLMESASAILASSERRVEAVSRNVSNASTAGYKKQVAFAQTLDRATESFPPQVAETRFLTDFSQGRLRHTGKPLDLAIHGPALLQLRAGDDLVYSRGGAFTLGDGGSVIDAAGRILQQAGGGDLVLDGQDVEILGDGTVLQAGVPVAAIGLYDAGQGSGIAAIGGSVFRASPSGLAEANGSVLRQGQLESSNVVMSDEMVAMMAAVRQSEGGARLAQTYDQLIGQAITTFSRSGR